MRWTRRGYIVTCCAVGMVLTAGLVLKLTYGERVFRRYVLRPIPKSVSQIKANRPWEMSGHRYVMHFKIEKADVQQILAASPFKEMVPGVEYWGGALYWTTSIKYGENGKEPDRTVKRDAIALYAPDDGSPGPAWFRPQEWNQPRVYCFREGKTNYGEHVQVLICNEELGEVYMVEYQEGSW